MFVWEATLHIGSEMSFPQRFTIIAIPQVVSLLAVWAKAGRTEWGSGAVGVKAHSTIWTLLLFKNRGPNHLQNIPLKHIQPKRTILFLHKLSNPNIRFALFQTKRVSSTSIMKNF